VRSWADELAARSSSRPLELAVGDLGSLILAIQRELFVAAAELATQPGAWDRQVDGVSRVSAAMVDRVNGLLQDAEAAIVMPTEFVVPGETVVSAALEVARTTLRRAERRAVTLGTEGLIPGKHLLPYLNRLADLLWVLARAAEQAEARSAPPSRPDKRATVTRSTR
jgi:cob(I)alamin adenosyltransferase